jgi:PKD repeat protein
MAGCQQEGAGSKPDGRAGRWARRFAAVLLTAGVAVAMSGCDSFETCHHRGHSVQGDAQIEELFAAFVCIGYHNPNVVQPVFRTTSGFPPMPVSAVQSGDVVGFDASLSSITPPYDQNDGIVSYEWDFEGNGQFVTSNGPMGNHRYVTTATRQVAITLRVTDAIGGTAEVSKVLTVLPSQGPPPPADPPPTASFVANPSQTPPESPVQFDASGSNDPDGQITDYKWDFGDGKNMDTGANPKITYSYFCTGTLTVTLTVTDEAGQTGQTSQTVKVTPEAGFPPCPSTAADVASVARTSQGRLFQAKFSHVRPVRFGTLTRRGPVATVRGLVLAGRLDGKLIGSPVLARFRRARFTAMLTLATNAATHLTTMHGAALATFPGSDHTSSARASRLVPRGAVGVSRLAPSESWAVPASPPAFPGPGPSSTPSLVSTAASQDGCTPGAAAPDP